MGTNLNTYRLIKDGKVVADGIESAEVVETIGCCKGKNIKDFALRHSPINGYYIEVSDKPSKYCEKLIENMIAEHKRQEEFFKLLNKLKVGDKVEIYDSDVTDSHQKVWYLYTIEYIKKDRSGFALRSTKGRPTNYTAFQLYEFFREKRLGV